MANIVNAISKRGSDALKVKHAANACRLSGHAGLYAGTRLAGRRLPEGKRADARRRHRPGVGSRHASATPTTAKIEKLVIAMEQARWLPDDLGSRYVFINQPAFMVYYHNNGQEQLSMRVVVGGKTAPDLLLRGRDPDGRVQPVLGRAAVDHHQRDAAEAARRSRTISTASAIRSKSTAMPSLRPASTGTARPTMSPCASRRAATMRWAS